MFKYEIALAYRGKASHEDKYFTWEFTYCVMTGEKVCITVGEAKEAGF